MGLEKRLNEMAKENFYITHTAVSQPIVPQPIVARPIVPRPIVPIENENGSKPTKTPDSVEVANNFWEEQCVPLYKELQAQDNSVRSHPVIRSHAQDLPKEESDEQVKRLQKLLQQQMMSLEAVKKREEQATAELKAKNEELTQLYRLTFNGSPCKVSSALHEMFPPPDLLVPRTYCRGHRQAAW